MPFNLAQTQEFMQKFYAICATFRYPEVMAVSRALNITPQTVQNWKYKVTFPRWQTAMDVIAWHEQGRPVTKVYQGQFASKVI